jgi:hypothetical protein
MKIFATAKINLNYSLFIIHYSFLPGAVFSLPVWNFTIPKEFILHATCGVFFGFY